MLFLSCDSSLQDKYSAINPYTCYSQVPGITSEEIKAIEELKSQGRSFIYGMTPSTEAFYSADNDVRGFSALFCQWLTEFFGIQFIPAVFEWGDLITGLETGEIDFSGDLTPTEKRRETYFMTSAITQRTLMHYRIKDKQPLSEIEKTRPLQFLFLDGSVTQNQLIESGAFNQFQPVFIRDYETAYEYLKTGVADAFFDDSSTEIVFDTYGDIVSEAVFPLIYNPISMSTRKASLEPVITILQKALYNGGLRYLTELNKLGYREYQNYKFYTQLTNEQKSYLHANPVVLYAADYDNYPVCFYNSQEKQLQGIAIDVLKEVELISGLTFKDVNNNKRIEWSDMLQILENGEVSFVTELIRTKDREEKFLWPETAIVTDYFALISKSDYPNISLNEILSLKVGLSSRTAYAELFNIWFPDHEYTIEYESLNEAFKALDRGEVDVVMSSQYGFLHLTNYLGFPDYKANVVFDSTLISTFGFNINEEILCSIINKAFSFIDVKGISGQWMRRTFDYRVKLTNARLPVLAGIPVFIICIFFFFLLLYRKINESKRLEKQVKERTLELSAFQKDLKEALESAKAANNSKSAFLANMSHEIRTPMNSIMGFSELALDSETSLKTSEYLKKIQMNVEWLLQIINDILDISKIESGKMELEIIPFDIHEIFTSCRALVMPKAVEKGLILHFYAEPSVGVKPLGDPTRLRQVFVNLLSNAVKFTQNGMVKVLSAITEKTENNITMHFEIKDSGIGMSKDQIEKIFEPFAQAETGTTRKYGGSGLGLAITKNIVEMMGGKLSVESSLGIGSKFSFDLVFNTIPVTDEERIERKLAFSEIEKPLFTGEVLVCEDNEMNQFVITEHLTRVGLKPIIAENGKIGIDFIKERLLKKEKLFDLILMDMHMPVMDGFEASAEIVKLNTGIPMVAMTANIMVEDMEIYKISGMPDCLGKPFTSQELWRCLLKYIKPL